MDSQVIESGELKVWSLRLKACIGDILILGMCICVSVWVCTCVCSALGG